MYCSIQVELFVQTTEKFYFEREHEILFLVLNVCFNISKHFHRKHHRNSISLNFYLRHSFRTARILIFVCCHTDFFFENIFSET